MKSTVKKRINFRNVQEGGNFFYVLREGKLNDCTFSLGIPPITRSGS